MTANIRACIDLGALSPYLFEEKRKVMEIVQIQSGLNISP